MTFSAIYVAVLHAVYCMLSALFMLHFGSACSCLSLLGFGRCLVYKSQKTLLKRYANQKADGVVAPTRDINTWKPVDPETKRPSWRHFALDDDGICLLGQSAQHWFVAAVHWSGFFSTWKCEGRRSRGSWIMQLHLKNGHQICVFVCGRRESGKQTVAGGQVYSEGDQRGAGLSTCCCTSWSWRWHSQNTSRVCTNTSSLLTGFGISIIVLTTIFLHYRLWLYRRFVRWLS